MDLEEKSIIDYISIMTQFITIETREKCPNCSAKLNKITRGHFKWCNSCGYVNEKKTDLSAWRIDDENKQI